MKKVFFLALALMLSATAQATVALSEERNNDISVVTLTNVSGGHAVKWLQCASGGDGVTRLQLNDRTFKVTTATKRVELMKDGSFNGIVKVVQGYGRFQVVNATTGSIVNNGEIGSGTFWLIYVDRPEKAKPIIDKLMTT